MSTVSVKFKWFIWLPDSFGVLSLPTLGITTSHFPPPPRCFTPIVITSLKKAEGTELFWGIQIGNGLCGSESKGMGRKGNCENDGSLNTVAQGQEGGCNWTRQLNANYPYLTLLTPTHPSFVALSLRKVSTKMRLGYIMRSLKGSGGCAGLSWDTLRKYSSWIVNVNYLLLLSRAVS